MSTQSNGIDPEALNREVQAIWEENAAFWDGVMGEGNQFQRLLIAPAVERFLNIQPGQVVLDVACGNGIFSRRMAQQGAQVVACDFSQTFLRHARQRTSEYATRIEYELVDVTSREQLLTLGQDPQNPGQPRRYDAAYCGMAIQDMVEIEPLFSALAELLKPGCPFVFSIPHPSFNNGYIRKVVEEVDREGQLVVDHSIKISNYIEPSTYKGLGIVGQPAPQFYFHRPLSQVYNTAFRYGFVLDGVEEPVLPPGEEASRPFSWANYPGIPPVIVSRMRLSQQEGQR